MHNNHHHYHTANSIVCQLAFLLNCIERKRYYVGNISQETLVKHLESSMPQHEFDAIKHDRP
nr:MAG TPA: Commd1 containing protein [Caudoviricetes sp.]